ncbi:hypothetical protein JCM10213_004439 [Rhodosporidiobolus nylandii]
MAAPARTSATAARTLATQATAPARPRRMNKRVARSSPDAVLASLTQLYHITPTFVPTQSPAKLSQHLTSTLVAEKGSSRPKPFPLGEVVKAHRLIDNQRVRLDASGSAATGLVGLDLSLKTAYSDEHSLGTEDPFDHRQSFFQAYTQGSEPPLAKRTRRIIDALHGTEAGGRAGVHTVREQGERAQAWKEGLVAARAQAREQDRAQEQDAEDFVKAFEAEEEQRP